MKKKNILLFILITSASCTTNNKTAHQSNPLPLTSKKFLFDNTKAETAGNADWVIDEDNNLAKRFPTPPQENITPSTGENYWTGALSSWGISLIKLKQHTETLQQGNTITYGDSGNAQDLSHYDVFIIDEPNIRFTGSEKTAIINFVKNGGGLFMISDHAGSDRNNDGWDSPAIWNDLMNSNSIQANLFGFSIDLTNVSEASTNITSISNPVMNGISGSVSSLKFYNGATITLSSSSAKGLVWQSGYAHSSTHVMAAYSTYYTGRIVIIGDSSPADDGTGARDNDLHNDWDASGNFFLNASLWLAKLQ
jgi:uncharacterized membrane protein